MFKINEETMQMIVGLLETKKPVLASSEGCVMLAAECHGTCRGSCTYICGGGCGHTCRGTAAN